MTQEKMDRISELTRIARERDLTPEEQAERKALREEYLADWRRSTIDVLENTYIDHGDGRITKLPKKKRGAVTLLTSAAYRVIQDRGSPLMRGKIDRKESEQCVFAAAAASGSRYVRRPVVVVRKEVSLSAGKPTAAPPRCVRCASTWSCSAGSETLPALFCLWRYVKEEGVSPS